MDRRLWMDNRQEEGEEIPPALPGVGTGCPVAPLTGALEVDDGLYVGGAGSVMSPSSTLPQICELSLVIPASSFYSSSSASASSTSSSSSSSSSFSPDLCLTPPLPPNVDASALLVDTRLVLDVYQGGSAALAPLWGSFPGQLRALRSLRLGSEDQPGLDSALDVLPHLTELRSLAIRGHCFHDSSGDPLPGLLTALPPSLSSLSRLVHVDLSFNKLSQLPPCLLCLPALSTLLLCYNRLPSLPADVGRLSALTHLSLLGNALVALPPGVGELKALRTLDVSFNHLLRLPDEVGCLTSLAKLNLSNNKLQELPETMGALSSLRELFIHSNDLRAIPQCLQCLPLLEMDVRDNPLGMPASPPPPPLPATTDPVEVVSELHLGFNQHRFMVSPAGCNVFLPCGAELRFPPGCVAAIMNLEWARRRPRRSLVPLEEHDILLSWPLELCPHKFTFLKPVEVCLPYHKPRRREVVVRRFDGQAGSTLATVLRRGSESHSSHPGGRPARLACCSVSQFSWFMVVSRPAQDSCSVTPAGAMLVSSADSRIKLCFPPGATNENRNVTLQVLQWASEVQRLLADPGSSFGPLLCLSQTSSSPFLEPVKVQVPLPPGVTGHTVDSARLHLMHGDPAATSWTDITSEVSLQVMHSYVIFHVSHFSWYWLWYTTQQRIGDVVRKVYQKLKQFRVRFIALQLKRDPVQVLLQCLPANKVEGRRESLLVQYDGPQPSDICDLLEGEKFFARFEQGLDISADRPDCIAGKLSFVFYSNMTNLKEVYVSPSQGLRTPVRGQVSFYRGEVPEDLPEAAARQRKGYNSQWLATLPLRVPALDAENRYVMEECRPLNLGDPESGYLTEANLQSIALRVGKDWQCVGINLGISFEELEGIRFKHRDNLKAMVLDMLFHWARRQTRKGPGAVASLVAAMRESDRQDLAEEIENILALGKKKYSESLRRVGLDDVEEPPLGETP